MLHVVDLRFEGAFLDLLYLLAEFLLVDGQFLVLLLLLLFGFGAVLPAELLREGGSTTILRLTGLILGWKVSYFYYSDNFSC